MASKNSHEISDRFLWRSPFFSVYNFIALNYWRGKGDGYLGWVRWIIAYYGVSSVDVGGTIFLGLTYFSWAIVLGFVWDWRNWPEIEAEFSNIRNPSVRIIKEEVRKHK